MIKSNDYILITDCNDNYYLRIGKVLEVIHDYDDSPSYITVEFSDRIIKEYDYDLPEKCKVLMFRN